MRRERTWRGFDYLKNEAVEWPRSEWRRLIASAARTQRVREDGSLLIFRRMGDSDRIAFEVYDRDAPEIASAADMDADAIATAETGLQIDAPVRS